MNRAMDNKEEKFLIHVQIEGFRLPLNIQRKEEEMYRNAEKKVLNFLHEYQKKYPQRTYEEVLKLVAFQLAVGLSKNEFSISTLPLEDKIRELDAELNEVLGIE
jgi:cell division protein ZapA